MNWALKALASVFAGFVDTFQNLLRDDLERAPEPGKDQRQNNGRADGHCYRHTEQNQAEEQGE